MKVLSFRITNFRSIIDTKWVSLSPDGITVLVGQNESGKTSMLEALHVAFAEEEIADTDCRIDAELPSIQLKIEVAYSEIESSLKKYSASYGRVVKKYLSGIANIIELNIGFQQNANGKFEREIDIESAELVELLAVAKEQNDAVKSAQLSESPDTVASAAAALLGQLEDLAKSEFIELIWIATPLSVFFNEEHGRLPNEVDIDENGQPIGGGAKAAKNFLEIADIDLAKLVSGDPRARETILNRANARVSNEFNLFWSQTIGKSGKLELKCNIEHYSQSTPSKAGKPYLVFWICDGSTQLYPMQRSQGVRWFVSFYLQLKASEKRKANRIFLLDEPGANLHSKAQNDVLKVINQLGKDISTVVYSTHSPQLLEYKKLFRVHAVQRDGEQDDSPTVVIDAHRLGTASSDTLSPILSAMGVDLSNQLVIRKTNNVLIEEMSGYYYLTSFWKLMNTQEEAHFIAATGVNKIEMLANMFYGWGLEFIVAVDDDKQGRDVYKSIKREMFGDDDALADMKLVKLPGCTGIEDVFSVEDFKKFVLLDKQASITGTNTEYLKSAGRSKPVLAYQFAILVDAEKVKWTNFDAITKDKITAVVTALSQRLKAH